MLTTVALLCVVSTALSIVFLFKSRPVRYYVKSEKGKEEEVEEGEEEEESEGEEEGKELLRRVSHRGKVKRDKGGERDSVVYTAANTEETVN